MLTRALCVALAALILCQCAFAYDPIALKNHCRDLVTYTSGPGNLRDHLNRWAFYFARKGEFHVGDGQVKETKSAWVDATENAQLGRFETFNHVHLVDDIFVSDNTCYVDAYYSFLAWNGACGPLIFEARYELTFTPYGTDAGKAQIEKFKVLRDHKAVATAVNSCNNKEKEE